MGERRRLQSKQPPPEAYQNPNQSHAGHLAGARPRALRTTAPAGRGQLPSNPGGGGPAQPPGPPVSQLPFSQNPGGPSDPFDQEEIEEVMAQEEMKPLWNQITIHQESHTVRRGGDPPSDDGRDGRGGGPGKQALSINKWAKNIPGLCLPVRARLQKASRVEQIWEMWSTGVALAMPTWNDVAVIF